MTLNKKLNVRKKKTSKLILVQDIKLGHRLILPLSSINKDPSRFKIITKED